MMRGTLTISRREIVVTMTLQQCVRDLLYLSPETRNHFIKNFFSNFEAFASELLKKFEDMFFRLYMSDDIFSMFRSTITHMNAIRRDRDL